MRRKTITLAQIVFMMDRCLIQNDAIYDNDIDLSTNQVMNIGNCKQWRSQISPRDLGFPTITSNAAWSEHIASSRGLRVF
ncbi:hypothetical protein GCM10008927_05240 [Amylibacter ulvae]|uniref:Uncharacterized protein n=1 Tax=Paramylibacter ulvae TaxID=1651968 RepID=A0ABQ3CZ67_9RHOB|nr:hypothetical protein GCM10008927_05240 [Amylibacter ulvae]